MSVSPKLMMKWEILDIRNPKTGQIFEIGQKYPYTHPEYYDCCRCLRNNDWYWHKMWVEDHWVDEKNLSKDEWNNIVDRYRNV